MGFFLFLLMMLGLPALITGGLIGADPVFRSTVGSQPGGSFEGRLVARGDWGEEADESLGGHAVKLFACELSGECQEVDEASTAEDGTFSLAAPAVEGNYLLTVGGGQWQRASREASFLDAQGESTDPGVIELPLRPGCELEVEFAGPAGARPISGSYHLSGELVEGAILGILRPQFRKRAEFEDGHILIDGLPPLDGRLQVFFGVGESVSLELSLKSGVTKCRVDL